MRLHTALAATAGLLALAAPAGAQVRPRPPRILRDRVRLMLNVGAQATPPLRETQTFQQYQEQGTFTLDKKTARRPFYDGGVAVRVANELRVGASVSYLNDIRPGTVTAQVPHPFFFNQMRATTGTAAGVDRRETAVHIQASWLIKAAGGLEFMPFAGPSIFQTQQGLVTKLNLTPASEVYPYDTLSFPGVSTETIKNSVNGYNAGVDMTWRIGKRPGTGKHPNRGIGLGVVIRYSHGTKDFTPTGGQAVKVEAGGLEAGGGLRIIF